MSLLIGFESHQHADEALVLGPHEVLIVRRGFLRKGDGSNIAVMREGSGLWRVLGRSDFEGFTVTAGPARLVRLTFRRRDGSLWTLGAVARAKFAGRALHIDDKMPVAVLESGAHTWAVGPSATRFDSVQVESS